jgi:hypothetical protein
MNVIPRDALDCQPLEVVMVPRVIGRCPLCGGCFDVQVLGYDTDLDGSNSEIVQIQADCENEDIEDDDDEHWDALDMPYVDLLPIEQRIIRWLNRHFVVEE